MDDQRTVVDNWWEINELERSLDKNSVANRYLARSSRRVQFPVRKASLLPMIGLTHSMGRNS